MMNPFNKITSAISEIAANKLLALDCEAQVGLTQFAGKSIHLSISDLGLNYFLRFPNGTVVISQSQTEKPSATISGQLSAFAGAAMNERSGDAIFTGDLHFSGDIGLAQKFQSFAQSLDLDWAKPIGDLLGDEAAHSITSGFKRVSGLLKNAWEQTALDTPEYLQEELQVTPPVNELEHFYQQIDLTRSQVERLSARINRLTTND